MSAPRRAPALRTLRRAAPAVASIAALTAALLSAGCVDFIAPQGRASNSPTRLDLSLHIARNPSLSCPGCITSEYTRIPTPGVTGSDTAVAWVDGTLDPGTDLAGETRRVLDAAPRVLGVTIRPADTTALGRRHYAARWVLSSDSVAPVVLEAPQVADVTAPSPVVHWSVPWSQPADTVRLAPGQDLPLVVTVRPSPQSPAPTLENWSVDVRGTRGFRIGADGPPPDTLVIPARFLPPSSDSTLVARMNIVEAITPRSDQDYQIVFVLTVALAWIVVQTQAGAT